MKTKQPESFTNVAHCVDAIIRKVGKRIVLALPLGLGKPCHLANELYQRAVDDTDLHLHIITGLSIDKPRPRTDIERRFLQPFLDRIFADQPQLEYIAAAGSNSLPENVKISEFYMNPGNFLHNPAQQQDYICSNYTHVARDMIQFGVNVCGQLVSSQKKEGTVYYSLSCNPDVTLDLLSLLREHDRPVIAVAQVNNNLPFMAGDAMVEASAFDMVLDSPDLVFQLASTPNPPVHDTDYMIGMLASSLIRDGGTLQIGIGSLGDAIAYGTILRHKKNDLYRQVLSETGALENFSEVIDHIGGTSVFKQGLYGCSEMFISGFKALYENEILTRKVYPDATIQRLLNQGKISPQVTSAILEILFEEGLISCPLTSRDGDFLKKLGIFRRDVVVNDGTVMLPDSTVISADFSESDVLSKLTDCLGQELCGGVVLHGGFFLGSRSFYDWLNAMDEEERGKFAMTSVRNVNHLFNNMELATQQRTHGRFINTAMMMNIYGTACSDGLENGQVVSGVGGQYNFVAMAHELPDGHSILMLRSTRTKGKNVTSNIVNHYGYTTIPRHLRDIVISEYGIVDIRGKSDHQVATSLINIADSRFQNELLTQAKEAGKIQANYVIPDRFRTNLPKRIAAGLKSFKEKDYFPPFPFGTDFTKEELVLAKVLQSMKKKLANPSGMMKVMAKSVGQANIPDTALPYLERMELDKPASFKERMIQKVLVEELVAGGYV